MRKKLTRASVWLPLALSVLLNSACSRTTNIAPVLATVESNAVIVVGTGEATSPPDVARVTLGVEARAVEVEPALVDANARAQAVIAALVREGIATRDIRTSNLEIVYEEQPPPGPLPPAPGPAQTSTTDASESAAARGREPRGRYRVVNSVDVTVRDLDRLGRLLAAATAAGANLAYGLRFEIDDPSALEKQARAAALADARVRAQQLAAGAGVALGPVLAVSEFAGPSPITGIFTAQPMMMDRAAASAPPIERGEIKVVQNVRVTYGIAGRWATR